MNNTNILMDLYHGSDHVVEHPVFGAGKPDNDYGSGFYTTAIPQQAEEWALLYGSLDASVSHYTIDLQDLAVLYLDQHGPLAWIAEVISNRGVSSATGKEFAAELVQRYKVDTSGADVIVGYRADDSYGDVIEAFMDGEITVEEVKKLFYKGELGEQYFIKSRKAFDVLQFVDSYIPSDNGKREDDNFRTARREVLEFLQNRRISIARRYIVPEISVADVYLYAVYEKELSMREAIAIADPEWLYLHYSPLHETSIARAWEKICRISRK